MGIDILTIFLPLLSQDPPTTLSRGTQPLEPYAPYSPASSRRVPWPPGKVGVGATARSRDPSPARSSHLVCETPHQSSCDQGYMSRPIIITVTNGRNAELRGS
jgi:hypothetical protein